MTFAIYELSSSFREEKCLAFVKCLNIYGRSHIVLPLALHEDAKGVDVYLKLLTSTPEGVCGQLHAKVALPPREGPTVPIEYEAGWIPEPALKF